MQQLAYLRPTAIVSLLDGVYEKFRVKLELYHSCEYNTAFRFRSCHSMKKM